MSSRRPGPDAFRGFARRLRSRAQLPNENPTQHHLGHSVQQSAAATGSSATLRPWPQRRSGSGSGGRIGVRRGRSSRRQRVVHALRPLSCRGRLAELRSAHRTLCTGLRVPRPAVDQRGGGSPAAPRPAPGRERLFRAGRCARRPPCASFEALRARADRHTTLHLDLSKVGAVEAEGCLRLSEVLRYLTANHNGVLLSGAERMVPLLRHAAEGNGATPGYWLLLLDLYQLRGLQADFERTALEYALAAGVNPPHWQPVHMPVIPQQDMHEKRDEPRYQSGPEIIHLHGVLAGGADPQLAQIRMFAQAREYINVNLARVARMDFELRLSAGRAGQRVGASGQDSALDPAQRADRRAPVHLRPRPPGPGWPFRHGLSKTALEKHLRGPNIP